MSETPPSSFKLSAAKKALLEAMRKEQASGASGDDASGVPSAIPAPTRQPIPRRMGDGPARLSFAQHSLLFLHQLEGGSATYNVPFAYRLRGPLQAPALQQAFNRLIERHAILRTRFEIQPDGDARQVIEAQFTPPLVVDDLSALPDPAQRLAQADALLAADAGHIFDLACLPLLRLRLVRLAEHDHVLIMVLHHNIFDEWSADILWRELAACYAEATGGALAALPALPLQYADYAEWQAEWLAGPAAEAQLQYWRQALDGAPQVLDLPADLPRPAVSSYHGAVVSRRLDGDVLAQLQRLANSEHVTLFTALLALYQAMLGRYSGQDDLLVGTPITVRRQSELADLIGFFLNTLALRADLSDQPSYRTLLRRTQGRVLDAFDRQDLPFERLVEALNPARELNRHPLFQAAFVLHPPLAQPPALPGVQVTPHPIAYQIAKFDLTLFVSQLADGLALRLEYATDLFQAATAERMLAHFETLLRAALAQPDAPLARLPLLTEAEVQRELFTWNDTARPYPRDESIYAVFQEARRSLVRGDEAALLFAGSTLSYDDLHQAVNELAGYLLFSQQINVGERVGLLMGRCPEMVISMLALMKIGAVYVPLDPTYPPERLRFMLADAGVKLVISLEAWRSHLPDLPVPCICLDGPEQHSIGGYELDDPEDLPLPHDPAYIMYTSGSTGQPKGIVIPQRAILRLVKGSDYCQVQPGERVAQASNMSFDAATFEIWGALLNGATLVGVSQDTALDPAALADFLRRERIDHLFLTTALFNQIALHQPQAFNGLKTLMFGGEAVSPEHVARVVKAGGPARLLHVYGPTESTTFATWHPILPAETQGQAAALPSAGTIPIGLPIANSTAYVLDRRGQPVPVGVAGELYLGGDGLALGYWQRPELTAEKFVSLDFSPIAGRPMPPQRLYRTGDLVRRRGDGAIEFLGRLDFQIKLRGFRVELGEIEAALLAHPQVQAAVVLLRDDPGVGQRLVAYWMAQESTALAQADAPSPDDLRAWLAARLPDYMLPAAFVALDSLPLNANGKLDRAALRALPAPEAVRAPDSYQPPADDIERRLCALWEGILAVQPVGVEDNFFALGGHSLLAVRLFGQIEAEFGQRLPLATLFAAPNVRGLARALQQQPAADAWEALVPVQPDGSRPPFYCVHNFGGETLDLLPLAQALGPDQPFFGLQALGIDGLSAPHTTITDMALYYVDALRQHQPHGPYYLGGYCFGGVVAYEMARQLRALGEQVALLAVIDGAVPRLMHADGPITPAQVLAFFGNLPYWLRDFWQMDTQDRMVAVRRRWKRLRSALRRRMGRPTELTPLEVVGEHVNVQEAPLHRRLLMELHLLALQQYAPAPYDGRVTLFRIQRMPLFSRQRRDMGWGRVAAAVTVAIVPGAHHNMMVAPYVERLAQQLKQTIG